MREDSKVIKGIANSNIALLKYWGKSDVMKNIPDMPSISINLANLNSYVELKTDVTKQLILNDQPIDNHTYARWNRVCKAIGSKELNQIELGINANNNFPTSAGLASSASGMAAMTVALNQYYGLNLTLSEMSRVASKGSASAARSIHGGFVETVISKGQSPDMHAEQLVDENYWKLSILICVTDSSAKKISSSEGMQLSKKTSELYDSWVRLSKNIISDGRQALLAKDFEKLSFYTELSCMCMHAVMMTTRPELFYWNPTTLHIINLAKELRKKGIPVTFTIDAGPQVKLITEPAFTKSIEHALNEIDGIEKVIESSIGEGAYCESV